MRRFAATLLYLALLATAAGAAAPPRPQKELLPQPGPASGFVVGTRLYTMRVYKRSVWKADPDSYDVDWFVAPDACHTSLLDREARKPELRVVPRLGSENCLYRWRISQKCFWCTGGPASEHSTL